MRDLTDAEAAAIAERKIIVRDNVVIRLTDLPTGYRVTRAEYFSFDFKPPIAGIKAI